MISVISVIRHTGLLVCFGVFRYFYEPIPHPLSAKNEVHVYPSADMQAIVDK